MFSKREIAQYASMPIEDGNHELKEFYRIHMNFLGRCSPSDFERSEKVMYELAVKLHNPLKTFENEWKIYATEMGVTDNTIIAIIEESARTRNELPLYVTMTRILKNINGGKLDIIIKALLNIPRYDALDYLRSHVQKLLDKGNTSDILGNYELKEFYRNHMNFLGRCSPSDFESSEKVMNVLAVKLHNLLKTYEDEWKIYATEMGVTDYTIIAIIEESARMHNELPLCVTMTRALKDINGGKLDNIIKALLNLARYDALEYLRPHVQKLLDKRNASEKRGQVSNQRSLENRSEDFSLQPSGELAKPITLVVKSEFSTNHPKCEVEFVQKNINSENSIAKSKSFQCLNSSEQNCEASLSMLEVKIFPSASLTVFIQHTEHDSQVANEIAIEMKKLGIVAKTSNDLMMLLMMNGDRALSTILREVDFLVPVVSKQFFQQIHPHMYEKCTESLDAMNNKTLYDLITTQYKSNGHVNFKVRSVLLPDMDRRLLASDVVLFYGLRLWEEFPKLVRMLRETKDLIPQHPFY